MPIAMRADFWSWDICILYIRVLHGRCSVLQCAAVCCSVLQCAAVCCSVLQCVFFHGSWNIYICVHHW